MQALTGGPANASVVTRRRGSSGSVVTAGLPSPTDTLWAHAGTVKECQENAQDIDRPSYFLVGERFLVRRAPDEADGEDWYGCKDGVGAAVLRSFGMPTSLRRGA